MRIWHLQIVQKVIIGSFISILQVYSVYFIGNFMGFLEKRWWMNIKRWDMWSHETCAGLTMSTMTIWLKYLGQGAYKASLLEKIIWLWKPRNVYLRHTTDIGNIRVRLETLSTYGNHNFSLESKVKSFLEKIKVFS